MPLWFLFSCTSDPTQPRYEFVPDMVDSLAFESFAPNPVTRDGKTLIAPVKGTIARGQMPLHFGAGKEEAERAGRELVNPLPRTEESVARGERAFSTFCVVCHGATGVGDGPVIPRFPAPPSLVAANAKGLPDGRLFHIVSRGQALMPSYASQISAGDRWRVVHFIRKLQGGVDAGTGRGLGAGAGAGADGGAR